jgi:hypothetical protein
MNTLAEKSKGDLLWLMSDDYEIQTPGWDIILQKYKSNSTLKILTYIF